MKAITRYQAEDGSIWMTPEAALEREHFIVVVDEAMVPLGPQYDDGTCDFANGHGYIQHSPEAVAAARANLMPITRKLLACWFKDQLERHGKDPVDAHPSWYSRILDGDHRPLDQAWRRIGCIDTQHREWGQQYFAANGPREGRDFEINRDIKPTENPCN